MADIAGEFMMAEIYFATNRNQTGENPVKFGPLFNPKRPVFFRVGKAVVKRKQKPRDRWDKAYNVLAKSVEVFDERLPSDNRPAKLGSEEAFNEIRKSFTDPKDRRDVLIFIHGFANSFENSLIRAAELRDAWLSPPESILNEVMISGNSRARKPLTIAFCWPSDATVIGLGDRNTDDAALKWAYFSDRDDAEASGKAIARSLMRLLDHLHGLKREERCGQRIHIVAHSMGAYALRHAVQKLKTLLDRAKLPRLIDNVFLMAADEDADSLELDYKLAPLMQLSRQVHVYHASNDRLLAVSDRWKFNPDRLGELGPKTLSNVIGRVHAIDCADVSDTTALHGRHQYYRLAPEVIADVQAVLANEAPDRIKNRHVIEAGRRYRLRRNEDARRKAGF